MSDQNLEGSINVGMDTKKAEEASKKLGDQLTGLQKTAAQATDAIAKDSIAMSEKVQTAAINASNQLEKTKTQMKKTQTEKARAETVRERGANRVNELAGQTTLEKARTTSIRARNLGNAQSINLNADRELQNADARRYNTAYEESAKRTTAIVRGEQQRQTNAEELEGKKRLTLWRKEQAEKQRLYQNFIKANGSLSQLLNKELNFVAASSAGMQQQFQMQAGGMSASQALFARVQAAANKSNLNYIANPPPPPTPPGGGGGGRGPLSSALSGAGYVASGLGSALGVGVGIGAIVQLGKAIAESQELAKAYERQEIAAAGLAGSQEKLNMLMDAYEKASGGAVDKATQLSNVTRLLATGFASSVKDVDRFVRATRGASIALGKPQDFVIQETQLAISNTSQKRLDQIGLGIKEVTDEVERLRAANKNWSRETAFQEAVISSMEKKYGDLSETLEAQATEVELLRKAWADFRLELGKDVEEPVERFAEGNRNILKFLQDRIQMWQDHFKQVDQLEREAIAKRTGGYYGPGQSPAAVPVGGVLTNTTRGGPPGYSEEAQSVIDKAYDKQLQITKTANDARTQEIESFEKQRESIIISYGKSMVREEEDFARQRARGLRDYERTILDVIKNSRKREEDLLEDYNDTVSESKEDSEKRISEIQEDYQESREKAAEKHRDALLKAAGKLDAIAVLEERKRWKEENEEAEKGHKKALENERESLQERLDDAREAYDKAIQEGKEADAERLEDMRTARALQLADEDEDRALRLERAKQDHDDQLAELDRQHEERLIQIEEQAAEETKALEDALAMDLAALGVYIKGVSEMVKEREEAIGNWIDGLLDKIEARASLDPDLFTAPSDGTTPVIRGSSRTANKSIVFNDGAIQINPLAGTDVYDLTELVRETVVQVLEME